MPELPVLAFFQPVSVPQASVGLAVNTSRLLKLSKRLRSEDHCGEERKEAGTFALRRLHQRAFSPSRVWQLLLLYLCSIFVLGTSAGAQVLYGNVVGTVTDPSGAVVPGAM